ncbi:hypothetical protein RRG08_066662 [Elysia crispata]|uniref:Uncharacterized protein n=1 Tax=Elysia crispata TaxID=231223 RepID=A0AAE1DVH3_9GAST|nr:hypothetical protein RRG08_066662 [Elysia crispata]
MRTNGDKTFHSVDLRCLEKKTGSHVGLYQKLLTVNDVQKLHAVPCSLRSYIIQLDSCSIDTVAVSLVATVGLGRVI